MDKKTPLGTAYEVYGKKNLPLVILIHGLGLNRDIWSDYIPYLLERWRVLTYDLYGHGQSDDPPVKPDLSLYAQQIAELLKVLNEAHSCHLIGFSLGGMINRKFAMFYPDKTGSLVVLNSPHQRDEAEQKQMEKRAEIILRDGIENSVNTSITRWFTDEFIKYNPETVQTIKTHLLSNKLINYVEARSVLISGVDDLFYLKSKLNHPALIITCENDMGSTPQMSYAIADEIINSDCLIVPKLKHMGFIERTELFLKPIINFLKKNYGS